MGHIELLRHLHHALPCEQRCHNSGFQFRRLFLRIRHVFKIKQERALFGKLALAGDRALDAQLDVTVTPLLRSVQTYEVFELQIARFERFISGIRADDIFLHIGVLPIEPGRSLARIYAIDSRQKNAATAGMRSHWLNHRPKRAVERDTGSTTTATAR